MPDDAAPIHALFVVPGGANGSRDGAAITPRFTASSEGGNPAPFGYIYLAHRRLNVLVV
jgi:hypothetical protein